MPEYHLIYDWHEKNDFFNYQRKYFISKALNMGYSVIDLEKPFVDQYSLDNKRLHFKNDGHWNEIGHKIVASEIKNFLGLKIRK